MKILCLLTFVALADLCAAAPERTKRLAFGFEVPVSAELACQNPENEFASDPEDCDSFYICDRGWPIHMRCPAGQIWTLRTKRCEIPEDAENEDCGFVYEPPEPAPITVEVAGCPVLCDNGNCVGHEHVCDGIDQCGDGSDEPADCAGPCNSTTCRLPDCFCSGTDVPGGLLPNEVPQMVVITWEGGLRSSDYLHLYRQLLFKRGADRRLVPRRNPNGCPIRNTFFPFHEYTDYALVQFLHFHQHEIATLSISHRLLAEYWANLTENEWAREIADHRLIYNDLSFMELDDVYGMRAPYLQPGGNNQFRMLMNNGFLYDNSLPTPQNDPPMWPYTLEYLSTQTCVIPPCPTGSFPGVWEVPMVDWLDTNDTLCNEVDNCYYPNDKEEALELFNSNFMRHYRSNRAPFFIHLRPRWFYNSHYTIEAMEEFLESLADMREVWVVTVKQAIDWIKMPTRLADIDDFQPWYCNADRFDATPICDAPNTCGYFNITIHPNSEDHPGERWFTTCAECPAVFPYTGNPHGTL